MFTHTLRTLGLAAALVAFAAAVTTLPASAARSDQVTVFKGRFVCAVGDGVQVPLAGADVYLDHVGHSGSSGFLGIGATGDVFGRAGVQSGLTRPDGGFRFEVPFSSDDNSDYAVRVALDGPGRGVVVRDWPASGPVTFSTGTNQNDVPEQDYHTQVLTNDECRVWLAFDAARANYYDVTGGWGRPSIDVNYDGPNRGDPWTDYLTVNWPRGYAADSFSGQKVAAFHEFAHDIRNVTLGGPDRQAAELTPFDFEQIRNPCSETSPRLAFYEGYAEFWAHDYAPAPSCPNVAEDDESVQGIVAWRLTKLERFCPNYSRQRIVTALADGSSIHSLSDLTARLGRCQFGVLNPAQAGSRRAAPGQPPSRYAEELHSLARATHSPLAATAAQLVTARRDAERTHCPPFPCTEAVAAKIGPDLLTGELAQLRLTLATVDSAASPSALRLEARPSRAFAKNVLATPQRLAHGLAAIGTGSLGRALTTARPLVDEDRSLRTRTLFSELVRLRGEYLLAAAAGARQPSAHGPDLYLRIDPIKSERAQRVHAIGQTVGRTFVHRLLSFDGLATGTPITNQLPGATFGSAQTLGFRGPVSKWICPAAPIAQHGGPALAPTCPDPDTPGYVSAGTMIRLSSPALTASIQVGTTHDRPGFAAEASLDAFDAAGNPVDYDSTIVHADDTGLTTLHVKTVARDAIVYLAVFSNGYWQQGPDLVLDNLAYTAR